MQDKTTGCLGRPGQRMRVGVRASLATLLVAGAGALPALASGPTVIAYEQAPVQYRAPAPQPSYARWDGGYYGFTLGYNFLGRDRVQIAPPDPNVIGTLVVRGYLLGVQMGRNWQRDNMVFGVEAGFNYTNTSDSFDTGTESASMRINPFVDLRARAGFASGQGLFYGVAGFAAARIQYAASDAALPADIQSTYTELGYSIGLGYEHDIGNAWSMRGEYSYTQYRGRNLTDGPFTTRATPDYHSVRFGLNRRF